MDEQYHAAVTACTAVYTLGVSVLMPARNAQDVINHAIESVQRQTFTDWEILVVDDGSIDDTATLAQNLAQQDPRIKIIRHNVARGAAAARNTALKAAKGRFIAFLDADDTWAETKLQRQLEHMRASEAGLCFTGFWRLKKSRHHQVPVPDTINYSELLHGNCIGCLTAMYDRSIFGSVAMPDIPRRHDFALWLTLLKPNGIAYGLNEPLATYHATSGSLSGNKLQATHATWKMYRHYIGLGRWKAAVCLFSHLIQRIQRG